ncbi:hypothetical protein SASPL_141003 [Salvia splendens]|uniref:Uncharacterized protein n=1 Tax=Salvia splendens TaxID=180675 RepID=A0A8X8ZBW2_SALSN|nr:hypothetical protein SASPL_141003 [Salvia splendens]
MAKFQSRQSLRTVEDIHGRESPRTVEHIQIRQSPRTVEHLQICHNPQTVVEFRSVEDLRRWRSFRPVNAPKRSYIFRSVVPIDRSFDFPAVNDLRCCFRDDGSHQHQPPPTTSAYHLRPRRELFEHGLLPIPKLIFTDGAQALSQLKSALLSSDSDHRVNLDTLARVLQIPIDQSRLIIETISSVSHDESDPLLKAGISKEIDAIGANVFDLLIFLYIQSYKRLLPKVHRDSAAVADVWPSTSAFDGFLSVLLPLQVLILANFGMY